MAPLPCRRSRGSELLNAWQGIKGGQRLPVPPPHPILRECFSYSPKFSSANVTRLSTLNDEAILILTESHCPALVQAWAIKDAVIKGCPDKGFHGLGGRRGGNPGLWEKADPQHHRPAALAARPTAWCPPGVPCNLCVIRLYQGASMRLEMAARKNLCPLVNALGQQGSSTPALVLAACHHFTIRSPG